MGQEVSLGVTKIDLQVAVPAIDLSLIMWHHQKSIHGGRPWKYRTEKPLDNDVVKSLFAVDEWEDGDPLDSDTANDDNNDDKMKEPEEDEDLFITAEAKEKEGSQATKELYCVKRQKLPIQRAVLGFGGEPDNSYLPHAQNPIAIFQG